MNRDLQTALGELADRIEQSHRASGRMSVEGIVARARRRRQTRAALITAGAAASVVVLAGAAFAVLPDRSPAPPATPAPTASSATRTSPNTPTTSPSTDEPVILPGGNALLPFGACGALADAQPEFPVDDRFSILADPAPTTVPAGEALHVSGRIEPPAWVDGSTGVIEDSGPTFVVTRDGVVVASANLYGSPSLTAYSSESGPSLALVDGWLPLTVCDQQEPPVSVGHPLPAGTYELRSFAHAVPLGSQHSALDVVAALDPALDPDVSLQDVVARSGRSPITVLGPVSTFTIVGDAATPAPGPVARPRDVADPGTVPTCGDPAPLTQTGSWNLHLATETERTTLGAGDPVEVTGTFSFDGPGRVWLHQSYVVDYFAVQDGVIVGDSLVAGDSLVTLLDLGTGSALEMSGSSVLVEGCDNAGGPDLGPGTYTVVPYVRVFTAHVTDEIGVEELPAGLAVIGTPFEVTIG